MANFENQILVGDYQDGRIYALDLDYFADDEERQRWVRSWRALPTGSNNLNRTAHHTLQLDLETGGPITAPAEEYTYLRVTVNDNWGGSQTSINSIAVYETIGGSNIATGGTPFASSGDASGVFSNTLPWFGDTASGEYVGYQFAAGVKPVQIAIEGVGTDGVKNFTVQVSTDNVNYVQVGSGQIPFTANNCPVISNPDLGLSLQDGVVYGTESDGTYIYKTVISQPSAYPTWDGSSINFTKTTYDLQGTVISTTSGSWTGTYVGLGAISGMVQNTTDYWWLTLFSSGTVYVFYQSTLLFAATDTGANNPFNSFVGTIKVQDKFYWWASNTGASYRYDKPSVYGSVAPTVKNVTTNYRMLSYDPVLDCLWGSAGNGITMYRLDFNLNIVSTHPLQSVFGFVSNGGFIAFNGILAVVGGTGSSPFSVVNNRFVIANFNVANNTQPTIIRQDSVTSETPNVGVLPPPSAVGLLQNGYAYYRSELVDLAGVATAQTFNLNQPANPNYADPKVMLRWSDDGGHTWSNYHVRSMGKLGEYGKRVIWRRLGMTMKLRDRVYEISGNDPVKIAIMGAELDVSGTDS